MLTNFHEGIQNFQGCVELYRRNESYMYVRSHAKSNLNSLFLSKTDADFVVMKIITNIWNSWIPQRDGNFKLEFRSAINRGSVDF